MSTSKTLAEKLASHSELEKRVSELIDIVEAEPGTLTGLMRQKTLL